MNHDCRMKDLEVVEDALGILYIRVTSFGSTRDHRVDFCPVCAQPSKIQIGESFAMFSRSDQRDDTKSDPNRRGLYDIPIPGVLDSIDLLKQHWQDRLAELNRNIDIVKTWMSAQGTHNSIFIERDLAHSEEISKLKTRLDSLEKTILEIKNG